MLRTAQPGHRETDNSRVQFLLIEVDHLVHGIGALRSDLPIKILLGRADQLAFPVSRILLKRWISLPLMAAACPKLAAVIWTGATTLHRRVGDHASLLKCRSPNPPRSMKLAPRPLGERPQIVVSAVRHPVHLSNTSSTRLGISPFAGLLFAADLPKSCLAPAGQLPAPKLLLRPKPVLFRRTFLTAAGLPVQVSQTSSFLRLDFDVPGSHASDTA